MSSIEARAAVFFGGGGGSVSLASFVQMMPVLLYSKITICDFRI
jgi:hypothetical protein